MPKKITNVDPISIAVISKFDTIAAIVEGSYVGAVFDEVDVDAVANAIAQAKILGDTAVRCLSKVSCETLSTEMNPFNFEDNAKHVSLALTIRGLRKCIDNGDFPVIFIVRAYGGAITKVTKVSFTFAKATNSSDVDTDSILQR